MMCKTHTTVDTLHSNTVLFVFGEFAEDLEKFSIINLRNQLYHFVQYK